MALTQERLKELLDYSPETGLFYWRKTRSRFAKVGSIAGSRDKDGYILIRVDQKTYKAHRLAWFYVNGTWPDAEVDHVDLNKSNNVFANLRLATKQENMRNTPPYKNNKCGLKGVYFEKRRNRYVAQSRVSGKTIFIGGFSTAEAAHDAYRDFAQRNFGQFARAS